MSDGLPSAADLDAVEAEKRIRWASILSAIPDVETWNRNLPELKRLSEAEPGFREFAMAEAEKRGYLWAKGAKCFAHPWNMKTCMGSNLIGCGWRSGQLAVVFGSKSGTRRYESVSHEVPVEIANKLVNSPFPDRLYVSLVKDKFQMVQI